MKKKLNKLGVENSLWNNIRAKRGSGKKPTKEMLKQEAKIKKEEGMKKSKSYKKGGSSFLEESKEVEFGYPKPMKYEDGGKKKERLNRRAENQMSRAKKNWEKAQKALDYDEMEKPETSNAISFASKKLNKAAILEEKAKKNKAKANEMGMGGKKKLYKDGGKKSMEPGGGGRFAKMVSKLKDKGKSEESAKAIAASIGRKKYGKSKFQEMAAKGRTRKKEEGGFEDDEMEMDSTTTTPPKRKKKINASAAARKRGNKARKRQRAGRTGCFSGNCPEGIEQI